MRAFVLVTILAVAGCASPCPAPQSGSNMTSFHCGDGSDLTVRFAYGPDSARVEQEGYTALTLRGRPAGSGYRYAAGGAELKGRGANATWVRPGAAATACRARR